MGTLHYSFCRITIISRWILFRTRNFLDISCKENQNVHFTLKKLFSKIRLVCEIFFLSFLLSLDLFLPIYLGTAGYCCTWTHPMTHTHTNSVWLLWTRDRPVAETATWQHTTLTTDRYSCHGWDSNSQSQQTNGRRHTPSNRISLYENIWKNMVKPDRPQMTSYVACALHTEWLRPQTHTQNM